MSQEHAVYPVTCKFLMATISLPDDQPCNPETFFTEHPELLQKHPFLVDLVKIEEAKHAIAEHPTSLPSTLKNREINPNLKLIDVSWQGLPELFHDHMKIPGQANGFVIIWQKPGHDTIQVADADAHDLLALKMVAEKIDSRFAAAEAEVSIGSIDNILFKAEQKGLLIAPSSSLVRPKEMHRGVVQEPKFFTTPTFTLQWHITQTCDLHCRHCYDRSERTEPDLEQCIQILDDLYDFCQEHHVFTQVTFTGGNPLLYSQFKELYQEAADRGFMTAILGNPMPRNRIEEILAIQKPEFYQVSLEGLREHNDYIRGSGHFDRVFAFLDLLKELDIYSMVMLTLTRANMNQVLKLAEAMRDRVDLFTFNRLAMVGEGAELASVPPDELKPFLQSYLESMANNPCMGLKDNLFNTLLLEQKKPFFGGCAGRGCGAAFNFLALLPDGEVHACRKFPSYIGNIYETRLDEIYHSELARKYRHGSQACAECMVRPVCGGCLAVTHGFGLDIFKALDPYCFIDSLQADHD